MTATAFKPTTPESAAEPPTQGYTAAKGLLKILFEASSRSESLMGTRHEAQVGGCDFDIPKLMLLGARGSGQPIRIALFAGLEDHGAVDGMAAITRLLIQAELNPTLAQDYAIFAYPLVNVFEYRSPRRQIESFDRRFANEHLDGDVRFFRTELRKWHFDGMLTLRTDPRAESFRATVRSHLLAKEVIQPTFDVVKRVVPVNRRPIKVRPSDMRARLADYAEGRLTPPPEIRPYPFEMELFAPGAASQELRIRSLFVAAHEILVNYRRMLSHAPNI